MRRPDGRNAQATPGIVEATTAESAVHCHETADLYSRAGRQTIGQLLAKPLQAWGLTPIELLHDLDAYRRLSNAGSSLQNAVQRAAVAQVAETGEPVGERVRAIYDIVDTAVRELHARETMLPKERTNTSFAGIVSKLETNADREFLVAMALATRLRSHKSAARKLDSLIRLLDEELPPWSAATLDSFLAEQLIEGGILKHRLASDNLARHLELCIKLSRGDPDDAQTANEPLHHVTRAIAQGRLPETADHIIEHVFATLSANRNATGEGLDGEFAALSSLLEAAGDGFGEQSGHPGLQKAFEERCARLLNPQALSDHIAQAGNFGERVDRLLDLAQNAIGDRNLRTIGERLIRLLDDPNDREFWSRPVGASLEQRMKTAARLQGRVIAGRIPESLRETLAARFDRICVDLLDRSALLERTEAENSSSTERSKRLLKLLAESHVTQGVASRRVRASIQRCFADPDFLAPFEQAESDAERETLMRDFHRLLLEAGFSGESDAAQSADGLTNFST